MQWFRRSGHKVDIKCTWTHEESVLVNVDQELTVSTETAETSCSDPRACAWTLQQGGLRINFRNLTLMVVANGYMYTHCATTGYIIMTGMTGVGILN